MNEWIPIEDRLPEDGEVKYDPDERTPFCPMCGSNMRGWNE